MIRRLRGINQISENGAMEVFDIKYYSKEDLVNVLVDVGCKDLLALIYYNYIATDEEKRDILKLWNENGVVYKNIELVTPS